MRQRRFLSQVSHIPVGKTLAPTTFNPGAEVRAPVSIAPPSSRPGAEYIGPVTISPGGRPGIDTEVVDRPSNGSGFNPAYLLIPAALVGGYLIYRSVRKRKS